MYVSRSIKEKLKRDLKEIDAEYVKDTNLFLRIMTYGFSLAIAVFLPMVVVYEFLIGYIVLPVAVAYLAWLNWFIKYTQNAYAEPKDK